MHTNDTYNGKKLPMRLEKARYLLESTFPMKRNDSCETE